MRADGDQGPVRPRPKPDRAAARRRLGRFFATDDHPKPGPAYPAHFPGVPRPEEVAATPPEEAPRAAGRPRPGRSRPKPR